MLNVIRMEITRMFKTRSFYITIAIGAILAGLMLASLTPSMNKYYDGDNSDIKSKTIQNEDGGETIIYENNYEAAAAENQRDEYDVACPSNICGSFIATASMIVCIFAACFVGDFYKNGFCKNVINTVKHRYYFQIAESVCIIIYSAIILTVNTVVTLSLSAALIHAFEFTHIKEFALYMLGEYALSAVMGISAAFFTELFRTKIPTIVYAVLSTSTLMTALVQTINNNVRGWGLTEFSVENYLPSLYQLNFYGDLPMENNAVIHALILSFAAFTVYNILASMLITKRDV